MSEEKMVGILIIIFIIIIIIIINIIIIITSCDTRGKTQRETAIARRARIVTEV